MLFINLILAAGLAHADSRSIEGSIEANFAAIQRAIQDYETAHPGETLSIPQVLARLPEKFRSGFTLMHTSRSIQEASVEAPRVILFGDDARTILTFNGHDTQAGHNKLEFASVNAETGKLEFRFMEFPENDATVGRVRFSQVNPPRCLACHGEKPHYIWGSYPTWPGAYGSNDDALELTDGEFENFKNFVAKASAHPRYKSLNFEFRNLSATAPYRGFEKNDPKWRKSRGAYQLAFEVRPNARLSMLLLRHQARARIAEMSEVPEFDRYKFGLAFHLAGCAEIVDAGIITGKTGLSTYAEFATRLGNSPESGWNFNLRGEKENYRHYYSGFWTFDSLLSYFLWTTSFAQDARWRSYIVPIGIADFLDRIGAKYKIFVGDRGREMFHELDRNGRVLKAFGGSWELKMGAYVPEAAPDEQTFPKNRMCRELAEAQPATR